MTDPAHFLEVRIPPALAGDYARKENGRDNGKLLARLLMEQVAVEIHLGHNPDGTIVLRLFPALGVKVDQLITAAGVPHGSACTLCRLRIG